jgi:hypothetical protein
MKLLEWLGMLLLALAALGWLVLAIGAAATSLPVGLIGLAALLGTALLLLRVLLDRLGNREDDHYDRNVDQ